MTTVVKRLTINLSKKDWEAMQKMEKDFGESYSMIVKRAVSLLDYVNYSLPLEYSRNEHK